MKKIEKTWGNEKIILDCELYRFKILTIKPGRSIHLQHHEKKDETIYVLSGHGLLLLKKEGERGTVDSIKKDDVYRIRPGCLHKIWAKKDSELKVVEVSNVEPDTDIIHHEDL